MNAALTSKPSSDNLQPPPPLNSQQSAGHSRRLILTTKRLVFDGGTENRTIKLADILSVSALLDAIEVSTQRRGKSLVLSVGNPRIWVPMIQHAAAGHLALRRTGG